MPQLQEAHEHRLGIEHLVLTQLKNAGWCTPGVHAPEITGVNRRQRDTGFTLTTVVHAGLSVVLLRFNSPLAHA